MTNTSFLNQLSGNLLQGVAATLNPGLQGGSVNQLPGVAAVPTATTTVQPGTAYYPVQGQGVPGMIFGMTYSKAALFGFGGLLVIALAFKFMKK